MTRARSAAAAARGEAAYRRYIFITGALSAAC